MRDQSNEARRLSSGARGWRIAAVVLAASLAGLFGSRALSEGLEKPPANPQVLLQPVEVLGPVVEPGAAGEGLRVLPAAATGGGLVQPSSSVEATALAIAYHALRDSKPSAEAVGKYAAEMMNAFSAARK